MICLSEFFPALRSDANETSPLGVIPIDALAVLWCLYFEKIAHWDQFEAGISVNISVKSITTRTFGYMFLKDSGTVSRTVCFEGQIGMDLK